jgi:hypothetical protein
LILQNFKQEKGSQKMTVTEVNIEGNSKLFATWEAAKVYYDLVRREFVACENVLVFDKMSSIRKVEVHEDGGSIFLDNYS